MLTWLRRLLVGAAALVLLVSGILLVLEESGWLARFVRERLARELGPLGARLTLEHAELAWFEPGIELVGLALASPEEAAPNEVELARVHVTLAPSLDEIRALRIAGGRVVLGPRLLDDWDQLAVLRARHPQPTTPHVSASEVVLELELFDRSRFELGTLDLCARPGAEGTVEMAGRLAPSLGGAIVAPDPIRVSGELAHEGVRVWASARELALETRALPPGALRSPLPITEGSARLTLDAEFELPASGAARPRGRVRAALHGGQVVLGAGRPPLHELEAELETELVPAAGKDLWAREVWDGRARLSASVDATPLTLAAQFGRGVQGDGWAHAWGRARGVPLDGKALAALGLEEHTAFARRMLDPRGRVDLAGSTVVAGRPGSWTHDFALVMRATGELGLTYLGFPGDPQSGLALPLTGVRGECVAGVRTSAARPWRVCVPSMAAEHGSGTLSGWMQLTAPERDPAAFPFPELDLVVATPSVDVDAALLGALAENQHLAWIGPSFAPSNGTLAVDFRVRSGPEVGGTSGAGTVRLQGVGLRWSDVPVQMDGVGGELTLRWAAQPSVARAPPHAHWREVGVAYRLDNRPDAARLGARAAVSGWVRELPRPPVYDPPTGPEEFLQELRIEIDELGLRGHDFEILAARFPLLEREVANYGAIGRMRVSFHGAQASELLPFHSTTQATPIEVHARPQFFQRLTRDLRGRVLIVGDEDAAGQEVRSARFVLTGTWPSGVQLVAHGEIPETGQALVYTYGAGIDADNTSFKGALITTLASDPTAGDIDLSSWTLKGPVDLAMTTRFDPASPAPPLNHYWFQLRDNDLRARDLLLRDLRGTLEQENDVMSSPLVEATLGGHPLELRNVRTFPLAVLARVPERDAWLAREGFWTDPQGRALQADLSTRDLPLDAEHLAGLLQPSTLESLRANSSFRAALDVRGARLLVTSEGDNQGKVAVRGPMVLHDLHVRLGLPIEVASAQVALHELVQESGRFRGWAEITDVDAKIAERELSKARMIAGYVDGRLTIDNLSGDFEGGRLESLGGAGGGSSKALGIDLSEPHRFDIAMRLSQVNVQTLLRGVFQSTIADEGVLGFALHLSSTPDEVLALTGRGSLSLDEGALWSIPVIRVLFAQLGFDKSGLFDRLRSRFEVRDGRIQVSHLEIRSSLLDLVGEGWQDLDGELSYDLEVRYGLLDKLGPLGRLLYWLNNSLMRVAVRGDFERPEVKIRNSIFELISGFDPHPPRRLPLPGFSTLGLRF